MKCSTCPYYDAIQRGDYNSRPWEETPCAQCKLGEDTFYSAAFDEEQQERTAGGSPALSSFSTRSANPSCDSSEGMLPVPVINSIIKGLLSLDPILRDIVSLRFQGYTYREIAERQGTSTQLAEMRHKRALREWPALESLFPEKVAKQSRRKSRQ